ncbi:unnamed protein product [Ranitomeya imitator]|uniref:Reverse transcriptase domain-containing protein n=1 Tax=Ranitomeya imitator TaxID=111125 RepID=A0ABN9L2Z0_9NEOB|nr:unnamed protein product [Ranitomeya imitator]
MECDMLSIWIPLFILSSGIIPAPFIGLVIRTSTAEELDALKIRIKTITDQHRRDTESRKRTKFQRDLDDYENNRVYRWQDKSTLYPNTTRSDFHSSIDLSTSGSETDRRDNPEWIQYFFRPAKTTTTTKKKRLGGANERRDADFYRVTRSQSFSKLRQDIEARKLHTSPNLSAPDFQALQSLRNDKNIIIKPADKGGAIVVMNRLDYTKEIYRQLHDDTVYRLLPADPTTMVRDLIRDTLCPYVEKGDFLCQLRNLDSLPTDLLLVSLDVKDLYTSIPHTQGILSVRHLLTNSLLNPAFLQKKIFMFEDQFYLQTKGTAMGSNVAPPYANSYMALFEEEIVYPDPLFQAHCPFWRRYIDDVFCLWTGTSQTLDLFFHTLNTAWPGLTFTMTSIWVPLKTDLYTKPTDRNSLLHYQSLHPTATKKIYPSFPIQTGTEDSHRTRPPQKPGQMKCTLNLEKGAIPLIF